MIALVAALGATAYTTGSVDRSSNVDVVTDNNGLIGLEDGTSGSLVQQNSTGALTVDFTRGGGTGVNTAADFELGNTNDPTNQTAFNITNNGGATFDLSVDYTLDADDSDTDANIKFQIYNSSGNNVATVDEESGSKTISSVSSGTTYYVVIVVNTHGLSDSDNLSGTFNVSTS
ncbi:hypothetical protein BRD00_09975 [Halobacteriales archaeon QS_8_69_26]|nr:MAG: hypothetical protein BRD00_09975 [Halobacteriales archaeon QS_8_69_26]